MEDFVVNSLSTIQPELVMCGGDLTEAMSSLLQYSQHEAEWQQYRDIVSRRWRNVTWLDIRGNHDNFNVLSRNSPNNFFAKYSVMGPKGFLNSYKVSLASRGQKFNFIAVDETWAVGMIYYNYVGCIDPSEQAVLDDLVSGVKSDEVTIMFGHYPASVVKQFDYVRTLISRGLVYLSGHLHNLGWFNVFTLYTFHNDEEDLELELVDWKVNRRFRVVAVYDGKLSFTDVKFDEWPIVVVAYPKNIQFMMPSKENYSNYEESTIKVLVFHKATVLQVFIGIDEEEKDVATAVGGGPLYVLPWDAAKYSEGVHHVKVKVLDQYNKESEFSQQFTLNPQKVAKFSKTWSNIMMRHSWAMLFHILYAVTLFFNLSIPLSLKIVIYLKQSGKLSSESRKCVLKFTNCCLIRKLVLVIGHNVMGLSIIIFALYLAAGPWLVGSLIEGHIGAVFAWGAVVDSTLVNTELPFAYYFVHLGLIHPVVALALGHLLDFRHNQREDARCGLIGHILITVLLLVVMGLNFYLSLNLWRQFGVSGFLVGPLKTWSYVFYAVMFWLAWRSTKAEITAVRWVLSSGECN